MTRAERDQALLIDRFELRGTVFERLMEAPDGWIHPQRLEDSPNVQRFAMDLYSALTKEGWRPLTRS